MWTSSGPVPGHSPELAPRKLQKPREGLVIRYHQITLFMTAESIFLPANRHIPFLNMSVPFQNCLFPSIVAPVLPQSNGICYHRVGAKWHLSDYRLGDDLHS